MSHSILLSIVALLLVGGALHAADEPWRKPDPKALENWREMRFGMFIHWGPVTLRGTEIGWSRGAQVPIEEYDNLKREFNPTLFNAEEWVLAAKRAGMKYIVITTKHHDGFCLWPSALTDHDIEATPFGRDPIRELADACKKHGIAFGAYYSTCDWRHPEFPRGSPGGREKKPGADIKKYNKYLRGQVRELIENYGPLSTIWFDVPQDLGRDLGLPNLKMIRELQPSILVNNRIYREPGSQSLHVDTVGDYSTPEQRVGEFKRDRPWETCMTICRQWAWKPNDTMKSLEECLRALVLTAGGDGNFLFNVGPMLDGRVERRQVERLEEMGAWLERNGESIYGTRGGPFIPHDWGASTCKGNAIYFHLFDVQPWGVTLPFSREHGVVKSATLLADGSPVAFEQLAGQIALAPTDAQVQPAVTTIKVEFDRETVTMPLIKATASGSLAVGMPVEASNVYGGKMAEFGPDKALDDDPDTRWATDNDHTKNIWLEVDLGKARSISRAVIKEFEKAPPRIQQFAIEYRVGDAWKVAFLGNGAGERKVCKFAPVTSDRFRLRIHSATLGPTIWEFQLFER